MELQHHLHHLRYQYVPMFEEGPARHALGRYVPALHAIFRRLLAIGAFDASPYLTFEQQNKTLRAMEDAVSFPGAQSVLDDAISHNDGARVTRIIQAGAFLDGFGRHGQGALMRAARDGYTEAALALIDGGVPVDAAAPRRPGETPLAGAFSQGHWATAAALLARGASLQASQVQPTWLARAMCGVSYSGDVASLEVFLAAGIDVNIAPSNGVTPLMCAAQGNQPETAALLIKAGADVNVRASHNRSALRYATSGRFAGMTAILKAAGAQE